MIAKELFRKQEINNLIKRLEIKYPNKGINKFVHEWMYSQNTVPDQPRRSHGVTECERSERGISTCARLVPDQPRAPEEGTDPILRAPEVLRTSRYMRVGIMRLISGRTNDYDYASLVASTTPEEIKRVTDDFLAEMNETISRISNFSWPENANDLLLIPGVLRGSTDVQFRAPSIPAHFRKTYKGNTVNLARDFYRMQIRYQTFIGSAAAFQARITARLSNRLRSLGFRTELFASPFNRRLDRYCSAFIDTDGVFGSEGSFFSKTLLEGYYECGPPYSEEVFEKMEVKLTTNIKMAYKNGKDLKVFIIVPNWEDSEPLKKLRESAYATKVLNLPYEVNGRVINIGCDSLLILLSSLPINCKRIWEAIEDVL